MTSDNGRQEQWEKHDSGITGHWNLVTNGEVIVWHLPERIIDTILADHAQAGEIHFIACKCGDCGEPWCRESAHKYSREADCKAPEMPWPAWYSEVLELLYRARGGHDLSEGRRIHRKLKKRAEEQAGEAQQKLARWHEAMTDVSVINWTLSEENAEDLHKQLMAVIAETVQEATDPAVSEVAAEAQRLREALEGLFRSHGVGVDRQGFIFVHDEQALCDALKDCAEALAPSAGQR